MNFVALGTRNTRFLEDITDSIFRTSERVPDTLHLFEGITREPVNQGLKKRLMGILVGVTE
jgi:hypothetical protein